MAAVVLVVLLLLLVVLATDQAWHEDQSLEPPLFRRRGLGAGGMGGGGGEEEDLKEATGSRGHLESPPLRQVLSARHFYEILIKSGQRKQKGKTERKQLLAISVKIGHK